MKAKKRNGSYRVQPTINGKRYSLTFDHDPTQKEIKLALAEVVQKDDYDKKDTFELYAKQYINNRSAVFSPSTIRTYNKWLNVMSDHFKKLKLRDIKQSDVQKEINDYAKKHAPKTVRSYHGFISTVLKENRPSMTLHTTLPQKEIKERYLPSESDIKRILKLAKGTDYSIPFQLGILSCRRSEICALTLDDLDGNYITISKNLVYNKGWEVKQTPKTDASYRIITIPDSLRDEILEKGYIFNHIPQRLNRALGDFQKKLKIPHFRFHDLRVYFASYVTSLGVSEADAMALGGWKSDFTFKNIYRKSMQENRKNTAIMVATKIIP